LDNIFENGIQIIQFFQGLGDWLIPFMNAFTFLGDEQFYLLVAPLLYWCIDTTIGFRTSIMLMVSGSINNYGKWLIHTPRPSWYSTAIIAHRWETTFGAISGHAMNAVTIWGILAASFRKKWLWILSILLMVLIGLSRIVLAVHFPHDVLLGWIFGAVILIIFIKAESRIKIWLNNKSLRYHLGLCLVISIAMILFSALVLLPLRGWTLPSAWIENANLAFPGEDPINPTSLSSGITLAGTFLGLTIGHKLTFSRDGFSTKGTWWVLILRYLLGVVGVFLIWFGLDQLFPDGDTIVAYLFRYIRYGLVGFWITFLGPTIFLKLKLAKPSNS
jgi:membrane-associated phospholipid phosphatase